VTISLKRDFSGGAVYEHGHRLAVTVVAARPSLPTVGSDLGSML
jgi:hypothetical protein